ncbi:uncharacterized protein LOC127130416 [Lathyrus oleraceus]|uniref:uncharacterized protein LOC127130416 n=1 Tax=Pisum sativum TaxID=3888 RepID=UPI0021D39269|nr:uncharacterized protein LOC127130416 [Pisum sativum]
MDETKDQFLELCKELKTLRGKDLLSKSAAKLCLVPNVKILMKFRILDIEKYKGNTCLLKHLVMYARKMSTQTDNDQLLIQYFQDSLTGAALRWYICLDSASVPTFNDMGEAFVKKYKYNVDMALDRDQLRSMSQKDKETFKEYAQRLRELASQITPPLEEKEITKMLLKTLSSFYYEGMIASSPNDFTEMGVPGHDIETRYPLKYEVQKLVKSGLVSFEDRMPNVKANMLPAHGNASVNMVDNCPGNFRVFDVNHAEEEVGTPFQALPITDELKKARAPMSSLKDAKEVVQAGSPTYGVTL